MTTLLGTTMEVQSLMQSHTIALIERVEVGEIRDFVVHAIALGLAVTLIAQEKFHTVNSILKCFFLLT